MSDTRKWDRLYRKVLGAARPHVRVGILASEGGNEVHGGVSMVELGLIHEFGAPSAGIPERSFIRHTLTKREKKIARQIEKLTQRVILGRLSYGKALNLLGLSVATMIKSEITQGRIRPKLQPETVARKGSSTPLVDTGRLLNSISHEVVDGS